MARFLFATMTVFALSVLAVAQNSATENTRSIFQASLPFVNLKEAQPKLDAFEKSLRSEPLAKGYIYVYGGSNSCPDEAKKITRLLFEYILNEREIDPPRIVTVKAGFRSEATVDLFVLSPGGTEPEPTPTIDQKDIQMLEKDSPQCKELEDALLEKKGA